MLMNDLVRRFEFGAFVQDMAATLTNNTLGQPVEHLQQEKK
jgi:hypothetical protein